MDSLSDIFGGKIRGMNTPMNKIENNISIGNMPKPQMKEFNLMEKGLDIEKKLNQKLNVLDSSSFNFKGKSFDIQKKISNQFSMPSMSPFGNKGKSFNMNNKMKMSTMNITPSFNYKGKVPSFNYKGKVNEIEKKMRFNINMGLEKVGTDRLNKQKGLSMFGDKDGDRVPNIFDCQPYDKTKQAFIHKTLNLIKGRGFKEDEDVVQQNIEPQQEGLDNVVEYEEGNIVPPVDSALEISKTDSIPFIDKVAQFGKTVGIIKTPEERLAIEKEKTERLKFQNLADIEKAKATAEAYKASIVRMPQPRRRQTYNQYGQYYGQYYRQPRRPYQDLGPFGGPLNDIEGGMRQFGYDLSSGTRAASPTYLANKISSLIGIGSGTGLGFSRMASGQPMFSSQSQMQQPVPMQQPTQISQSRVYSPYSKKPVTYTRGPYRKNTMNY